MACNNSEEVVNILSPLEDKTINEMETVTFECEVSKSRAKVTYLKDGKEIEETDRVKITAQGTVRRLTISDSVLDDQAEYTVKVTSNLSTSAKLTVEGQQDFVHHGPALSL